MNLKGTKYILSHHSAWLVTPHEALFFFFF